MTCPFASIVKATAPTVGAHTENIVHDFYPRMFKNNPETKAFFNPANQFAEPPTQRMALANAIVAYATNIEDLTPLTSAVQIIANKHCGLQVKAEHYPIVDENLAAAVLEVLGEDVVTPEIGGAWREAVQALAKILIDTELGLTEEAANRSGGWRGVKDFRITGIRDVTETCREFTFEAADGDKNAIDFTAGQFLTVHLQGEGLTPRHYSVTNAPGKSFLQCCVKKIPGGAVSNALHSLKEGDVVPLAPPFGLFKMNDRPAVLISAGIGATPMKSFLDSSVSNVKLVVHVDSNETTHPFKSEMEASGVETKFIYTQQSGRPVPGELVAELQPYLADHDFYLCASAGFSAEIHTALKAAGASNIYADVFGPTLAGVHLPK